MTTFAIGTLGCKVNAYESQGYIEGLLQYGLTQVDFKEVADIYIINTCAVTNTAASKSKQKIHQAQKRNPKALICVVGCFVQTSKEALNVDLLVGSSHKNELPAKIMELLASKEKQSLVEDITTVDTFERLDIHSFSNHTRAFLKIQDGCNQFCSYCIIPYARGKERSLPIEEVLMTARKLVENNHKEIVLSGIHTGRYGRDIGTDLLTLLTQLEKIEGLERIRISSIEMNEISEEFIHFMKDHPKVAHHLHIPIQSACNRTLKMMNRPYSVEQFIEQIQMIRSIIPTISISTDMIMGFPDEREEDYEETLRNVEKIQFSFIHVFPFSKRDGTKACEINNHLTNTEKKKRCQKVSLLSKKHYNDYKLYFVNKEVDVLFEYEKDGYLFGHTSEYIPLKASVNKGEVNMLCTVKITSLKDGILYSE
ncbi:MAG: tRNA (N(6)-L-threonylcarbamoyladenosine(37)-C(2))-methylthiotransferase MtaB [Erysipelotrichia bacterium]|nr:tRNA (N(6)-L-threonylcarbamoyladenosine(37)-C(2))-methylthiotransferase MtaB [Erysipelotrichia bacterium]NCC54638.1 tRNA (N(6)-L-threonylcarbamoyladenosine(37)-C(2))-methylthiotransferase MtaB [Erysipelotrichia bacterium]